MPELKIKTQGAGSYDQSIIDAERVLQELKDQEDYAKTLDEFDVTDRKKNAEGGIMSTRAKFKSGKVKLAQFFYAKGTDLVTEIRKAVNNIFESGDKKVDADMAVDDMLDEFGIDRGAVDQKDILQAYDEAYKTLSVPPGSRGGPDDIAAPVQSAEDTLKDMVKSEKTKYKQGDAITSENFGDTPFAPDTSGLEKAKKLTDVKTDSTGNLVSKQLKVMRIAEDIEPGLFEKLTDIQLEIIAKYGDMIDDNLLRQIILDKDPNNQALALAQIEEAKVMIDKGMDVDEILRIQGESLKRKKQAEGGIAEILKL